MCRDRTLRCGPAIEAPRLIRIAEVRRRTPVSTSAIYRWMHEGKFPKSHKVAGYIAA